VLVWIATYHCIGESHSIWGSERALFIWDSIKFLSFCLLWLIIILGIKLKLYYRLLDLLYISLLVLPTLSFCLCYQETLLTLSCFAQMIHNWLKWSLFSSIFTFFPHLKAYQRALVKVLSCQLLPLSLLLLSCTNP
jgi:hypothetical protein